MSSFPNQFALSGNRHGARGTGRYAFREGCSPETIREDFEGLTLARVYGAIAFYLDHQANIDAYLLHRKEQWAELERQGTAASQDLQARLEHARGSVSLPR
jgi:hypothetical protein